MLMTRRQIIKLTKEHGGKLVRNGASHDIYVIVDKRIISVPRHAGDLTPGVERSIKKALGL